MSQLLIGHEFGQERISAIALQANFEQCRDALNTINGDNFDARSITNECLVAHTVPSMVTFEPSHGLDISWATLGSLGTVTHSDWEVYKMAVWCTANGDSATVQLATSDPTASADVVARGEHFILVGPKITPSSTEVTYTPVSGLTLKKGQALWYQQLTTDGDYGAAGIYTASPISKLRISIYFRMPLRSS